MAQNTDGIQNHGLEPTGRQRPDFTQPSSSVLDQPADLEDATIHSALVSGLEELSFKGAKKADDQQEKDMDQELDLHRGGKGPPTADEDRLFECERAVTMQYLLDNVAEFRELTEVRKKVNGTPSLQSIRVATDSRVARGGTILRAINTLSASESSATMPTRKRPRYSLAVSTILLLTDLRLSCL